MRSANEADTQQEVAASGLPVETLKVYEAKGQVLELIEDLNRVAKIAFDGEAAMVGQFNKDVLERARKPRKKKKEATETGSASASATSPTTAPAKVAEPVTSTAAVIEPATATEPVTAIEPATSTEPVTAIEPATSPT